jgi:tetratricopeptide (TPR) repeat protein
MPAALMFALVLLSSTQLATASERRFVLEDTRFMVGHWRAAESMGAPEELWLPPRAGVMTGFFRWPSVQGQYVLELLTIAETEQGVLLRFKHFNPDVTAWEKQAANTYVLTAAADDCVVFTGIDTPANVPAVMQYCRPRPDALVFRGADADTPVEKADFVIPFVRQVEASAMVLEVETGHAVFPVSCKPEVQADFDQAVTLLHSFEYPETSRRFREILHADPDCAMARWGIAMSLWHPLWAPPSQSALEAGKETLDGIRDANLDMREKLFIKALSAFYSDTDTSRNRQRASNYAEQMRVLYEYDSTDSEATAFYALALLAAADPRDKSYARQYQAGSILAWLRESQPLHPGALHYTIHSYDYPGMAHLALPAAMVYARAAPDSAHAQHMPSHIFTRMGLWDYSLASNHDSTASAAAYTERAQLVGHYDEGLHSIDYLMYAMLQTARDDEALALLDKLGGITRANIDSFKVAYTYAASPARYALERHQWQEAAKLQLLNSSFPWQEFAWARSIHHFARGLGAARSGDISGARTQLVTILEIRDSLSPDIPVYWREEVAVQALQLEAWIALGEGDIARAGTLAESAADREDAVDKHPVTPGEVLPARELYADLLLEIGEQAGALAAYQAVLESSPNRYNALLGAARSAAALGDVETALENYRQLLVVAHAAAPGRTSLAEAERYTSTHSERVD